jgi:hypothetical protein
MVETLKIAQYVTIFEVNVCLIGVRHHVYLIIIMKYVQQFQIKYSSKNMICYFLLCKFKILFISFVTCGNNRFK